MVEVIVTKADLADAQAGLESSRTDVPLATATTGSALNNAKAQRQDAAAGITYAQNQLSAMQARLGLAQANVKVAEANAMKAAQDVTRYQTLVAKDGHNAEWQRDIAASYSRLGDVEAADGHRDDARSWFEQCVAITRSLALGDPSNLGSQRDLAIAY